MLLNKLDNLSAGTEQQVKIVEQSIERNWLSVFPLKQGNDKSPNEKSEQSYDIDDLDSLAVNLR